MTRRTKILLGLGTFGVVTLFVIVRSSTASAAEALGTAPLGELPAGVSQTPLSDALFRQSAFQQAQLAAGNLGAGTPSGQAARAADYARRVLARVQAAGLGALAGSLVPGGPASGANAVGWGGGTWQYRTVTGGPTIGVPAPRNTTPYSSRPTWDYSASQAAQVQVMTNRAWPAALSRFVKNEPDTETERRATQVVADIRAGRV